MYIFYKHKDVRRRISSASLDGVCFQDNRSITESRDEAQRSGEHRIFQSEFTSSILSSRVYLGCGWRRRALSITTLLHFTSQSPAGRTGTHALHGSLVSWIEKKKEHGSSRGGENLRRLNQIRDKGFVS